LVAPLSLLDHVKKLLKDKVPLATFFPPIEPRNTLFDELPSLLLNLDCVEKALQNVRPFWAVFSSAQPSCAPLNEFLSLFLILDHIKEAFKDMSPFRLIFSSTQPTCALIDQGLALLLIFNYPEELLQHVSPSLGVRLAGYPLKRGRQSIHTLDQRLNKEACDRAIAVLRKPASGKLQRFRLPP